MYSPKCLVCPKEVKGEGRELLYLYVGAQEGRRTDGRMVRDPEKVEVIKSSET